MREELEPEDTARRRNAKVAARKAAAHFSALKPEEKSSGRAALYMWGTMAAACFVLAGSIGLFPGLSSLTQPPGAKSEARLAAKQPLEPLQVPVEKSATAKLSRDVATIEQREAAETNAEIDRLPTGSVSSAEEVLAPLAQPVVRTGELGVEIGRAENSEQLAIRYQSLRQRRKDLFEGIVPKIGRNNSKGTLVSSLIVGPFETPQQVSSFCRSIKLQLTIDCAPTRYRGLPLE